MSPTRSRSGAAFGRRRGSATPTCCPTWSTAGQGGAARFQVGLVTFGSTAQTLVPPTTDQGAVQDALTSVQAQGGTALGDGIQRALEVKRPSTTRPGSPASAPPPSRPAPAEAHTPMVILLLSDGASTTGRTQPLDAGADARQLGVAIYAIALGTDTGTIDTPDIRGQPRRIPAPPDRTTLRRLAEQTGGRAYDAPSSRGLKSVYDEVGSTIGFVKQRQEMTVAFTASAVVLLAAGGILSLLWFNRLLWRQAHRSTPTSPEPAMYLPCRDGQDCLNEDGRGRPCGTPSPTRRAGSPTAPMPMLPSTTTTATRTTCS